MLSTNIIPVMVFPDTATTLRIVGVHIILEGTQGYAQIQWQLLNERGSVIKSGAVGLSGEDYDSWGTDDNVLLVFTMARLGLSPSENSAVTEPAGPPDPPTDPPVTLV